MSKSFRMMGLSLLIGMGCAPKLHPDAYRALIPESIRRSLRKVEVVTQGPPEGAAPRLEGTFGKGQGARSGALEGAGGGALAGLYVSVGTGPFALILAPVLVPTLAVVGGIGGAVIGAVASPKESQGNIAQGLLERNRMDLSKSLAARVAEGLPTGLTKDTGGLPVDLAVSVSVDSWGLEVGAGGNPKARFFMTASFGVALPGLQETLPRRTVELGGQVRRLSEWNALGGEPLGQAMTASLNSATEAVLDSIFRVQDFFLAPRLSGYPCGLRPLGVAGLASGRPTLTWEAFPRKIDLENDAKGLFGHVTQISYDLRIWEEVGISEWVDFTPASGPNHPGPGQLLYERRGIIPKTLPNSSNEPGDEPMVMETVPGKPALTVPMEPRTGIQYRLEETLPPHRSYLWSVRARFLLDGEERLSRWSMKFLNWRLESQGLEGSQVEVPCGCRQEGILPGRYHRFTVP